MYAQEVHIWTDFFNMAWIIRWVQSLTVYPRFMLGEGASKIMVFMPEEIVLEPFPHCGLFVTKSDRNCVARLVLYLKTKMWFGWFKFVAYCRFHVYWIRYPILIRIWLCAQITGLKSASLTPACYVQSRYNLLIILASLKILITTYLTR